MTTVESIPAHTAGCNSIPDNESAADAINVEGEIAGAAQAASGAWHAAVSTHPDFKATDLNLEISPARAKQYTLTPAGDTNDRCKVG